MDISLAIRVLPWISCPTNVTIEIDENWWNIKELEDHPPRREYIYACHSGPNRACINISYRDIAMAIISLRP